MNTLFQNILTASFHGSIVILAVMLLRLVLKKTPRKYICLLWLLAGLRLLMPFQIQSDLSLQPSADPVAQVQQFSHSQAPKISRCRRRRSRIRALHRSLYTLRWCSTPPTRWHRCSSSAILRRPPRRKISPRQTWKPPRRCRRRFRISSPPSPP